MHTIVLSSVLLLLCYQLLTGISQTSFTVAEQEILKDKGKVYIVKPQQNTTKREPCAYSMGILPDT